MCCSGEKPNNLGVHRRHLLQYESDNEAAMEYCVSMLFRIIDSHTQLRQEFSGSQFIFSSTYTLSMHKPTFSEAHFV